MRVFTMDGRFYLEAWCRRAEGMRVFRLDRIENARLLDEPARPPAEAHLRDLSEGVYTPAPEHLLVVLRVAPGIRLGSRLLPGDRGHRDRGRPAPDQRAGRGPRLGTRARPRLGRAGRGVVAGVAGRVGGQRGGRSYRRVRGVLTGPIQAAAVKSAECGGSWRSRGALR